MVLSIKNQSKTELKWEDLIPEEHKAEFRKGACYRGNITRQMCGLPQKTLEECFNSSECKCIGFQKGES